MNSDIVYVGLFSELDRGRVQCCVDEGLRMSKNQQKREKLCLSL